MLIVVVTVVSGSGYGGDGSTILGFVVVVLVGFCQLDLLGNSNRFIDYVDCFPFCISYLTEYQIILYHS